MSRRWSLSVHQYGMHDTGYCRKPEQVEDMVNLRIQYFQFTCYCRTNDGIPINLPHITCWWIYWVATPTRGKTSFYRGWNLLLILDTNQAVTQNAANLEEYKCTKEHKKMCDATFTANTLSYITTFNWQSQCIFRRFRQRLRDTVYWTNES